MYWAVIWQFFLGSLPCECFLPCFQSIVLFSPWKCREKTMQCSAMQSSCHVMSCAFLAWLVTIVLEKSLKSLWQVLEFLFDKTVQTLPGHMQQSCPVWEMHPSKQFGLSERFHWKHCCKCRVTEICFSVQLLYCMLQNRKENWDLPVVFITISNFYSYTAFVVSVTLAGITFWVCVVLMKHFLVQSKLKLFFPLMNNRAVCHSS